MLLIDGDLRHGSASSYIDSPAKGLSDYLGGRIDNLDEIIVPDPKHKSMDILPVGTIPPNPTELLFDERLKQTIDTVREQYDYVLIDCPPVELVADTQIIEKLADRTISWFVQDYLNGVCLLNWRKSTRRRNTRTCP